MHILCNTMLDCMICIELDNTLLLALVLDYRLVIREANYASTPRHDTSPAPTVVFANDFSSATVTNIGRGWP